MNQLISNSEVKYPISLIILSILITLIPLIILLVVAVVYDVSMFEPMVIGIALGILLRIMGVKLLYFPKHLIPGFSHIYIVPSYSLPWSLMCFQ